MNLTLLEFLAFVAPIMHLLQRRRQSSKVVAGGIFCALTGPMALPQLGQSILGNVGIRQF